MGLYESMMWTHSEDGHWYVSNTKWSMLVDVCDGLITSTTPEKKKWIGKKFKDFIAKESYGRFDKFKTRKLA